MGASDWRASSTTEAGVATCGALAAVTGTKAMPPSRPHVARNFLRIVIGVSPRAEFFL